MTRALRRFPASNCQASCNGAGRSSHVQAEAIALPRRGHLDDPTATRAHAEQLLDAECALAGIPRVRLADDGEG